MQPVTLESAQLGGQAAVVTMGAKPLAGPVSGFRDANEPAPAKIVGFEITVNDLSGNAHVDGFTLEPSGGGSAIYGLDDLYPSNRPLEQTACHGKPFYNDVMPAATDISGGVDLAEGSTYSMCVVFEYFGAARPTTLSYRDNATGVSTQLWTGTIDQTSPETPSETDAPTVDPYPEGNGKKLINVADGYGGISQVYMTFDKIGRVMAPWHDGPDKPANAVAFKVTLTAVDNDMTLGMNDKFALEPSNGGSWNTNAGDNQRLAKALCGRLPMLDTVFHADATAGWSLSQGQTYKGCMIFDFFGSAKPTTITHSDGIDGVDQQTIWTGHVGGGPADQLKPSTLASWSGGGSRTITVPAALRDAAQGTKVCWDMTGSGNHIIQTESDTAGSDLKILTNTLGTEDKQCQDWDGANYIQVLAENPWSIKITGYPQ